MSNQRCHSSHTNLRKPCLNHLECDSLQLIESLRLAFADTNFYVADPEKAEVPLKGLLSREYARERAALIDKNRVAIQKDQKRVYLRFLCDIHSIHLVDQSQAKTQAIFKA